MENNGLQIQPSSRLVTCVDLASFAILANGFLGQKRGPVFVRLLNMFTTSNRSNVSASEKQ